MTDTTTVLTPAENRARAAQAMRRAAGINPGADSYRSLVLTAVYHELAAISLLMEPPPAPQVPGLPIGYTLETIQAEKNNRLWGYVLTTPDGGKIRSRFQWSYSETALKQGIRHASELAGLHAINGTGQDTTLADLHTINGEPLPGTPGKRG
jgi:hypothetical protein